MTQRLSTEHPALISRYAEEVRKTYFESERPFQTREEDTRRAFEEARELICAYAQETSNKNAIENRIESLLQRHPYINDIYVMQGHVPQDLATLALENKAWKLAEFFINGENKASREAADLFLETEARIEGNKHFDDEDNEPTLIIPKSPKQKAILLMLYATQSNSFACEKNNQEDLAHYLIRTCHIDPHSMIEAPIHHQTPVDTPFRFFLQRHPDAGMGIAIPEMTSMFLNSTHPRQPDILKNDLALNLIFAGRPNEAAIAIQYFYEQHQLAERFKKAPAPQTSEDDLFSSVAASRVLTPTEPKTVAKKEVFYTPDLFDLVHTR